MNVKYDITSAATNIFEYSVNDTTARAIVVEDKEVEVIVPTADGDTQISMNLPDTLSRIKNFSEANWTSLTEFKMTNLDEFDISGMTTLSGDSSLGSTANSIFRTMLELRTLDLREIGRAHV